MTTWISESPSGGGEGLEEFRTSGARSEKVKGLVFFRQVSRLALPFKQNHSQHQQLAK